MNVKLMDEPRQTAIDALKDYIYFIDELGAWAGLTFKEQSCCKFAANELLRLLRQSNEPPLVVIYNFYDKMECAYKRNRKKVNDNVFFTSMQVADHIIMNLTS